jgi:hypothetical protein
MSMRGWTTRRLNNEQERMDNEQERLNNKQDTG